MSTAQSQEYYLKMRLKITLTMTLNHVKSQYIAFHPGRSNHVTVKNPDRRPIIQYCGFGEWAVAATRLIGYCQLGHRADGADRPLSITINKAKFLVLRHGAACFKTPMCRSKKNGCCGVLRHAAAAHAW